MTAATNPAETSRTWVLLHLHEVERCKDDLVTYRVRPTEESFKAYCRELRLAKLRYFDYDRQDPGAFDEGANLLIKWTGEVLALLAGRTGEGRSIQLTRKGIEEHRTELERHVATAVCDREAIF
ncbi:MAG: hypothetical protein ACKV19_00130 [Verrucomicrobiales bacterium]